MCLCGWTAGILRRLVGARPEPPDGRVTRAGLALALVGFSHVGVGGPAPGGQGLQE